MVMWSMMYLGIVQRRSNFVVSTHWIPVAFFTLPTAEMVARKLLGHVFIDLTAVFLRIIDYPFMGFMIHLSPYV